MRCVHVAPDRVTLFPADESPADLPATGFLWWALSRAEVTERLPVLQERLQRWAGGTLVDLHVADLLNAQLPSHFDATSLYDLLVFRRLTAQPDAVQALAEGRLQARQFARDVLDAVDTRAVGFAIFDRLLVTVHPEACAVLEHFAQRLADGPPVADARGSSRTPTSPADLMLRMVNHMVDGYLALRRLLTRQLGALQQALLDPKSHFNDWQLLVDSRAALHELEDTCEDQRAAVQEWLDALDEWPPETDADRRRERELLRLRTRDVLEHVERVLSHVRRLEQSAETSVQMHFSALSHRTNDIMRTLTVLTAVFLPLNLITGFFGMNFDGLPLIHSATGVWIALGMMVVIAVALGGFFWRRRYLGGAGRRLRDVFGGPDA
jgi:Mg2+ and Co2+ transporter CorA